MKVFEILNFNREPLKRLQQAGIRIEDVEYIDLYNDYRVMLGSGEKVSYIVATLADRYHVSERKVYTLIKRYGRERSAQVLGWSKAQGFWKRAAKGLQCDLLVVLLFDAEAW